MKNMAKKSSFFKASSLCLILSFLGINVFKCEASLQEDVAGESQKRVASSSAAGSLQSKQEGIPPELLEPMQEEKRKEFWGNFQTSLRELLLAGFNYQSKIAFDETVAQASVTAFPIVKSCLANVRKANVALLEEKQEKENFIAELRAINLEQKARIDELEKLLQASREMQEVTSENEEKDRIADLEAANESLVARIKELERAGHERLQVAIEIPEDRVVTIGRSFIIWKPWTWFYLFYSAPPVFKSKV